MVKLSYFGVPVYGAAEVFCYKKSVVNNSSIHTSVLKNRHNAIFYHRLREYQAADVLCVRWIIGEFNPADLFTKTTIPGNKGNNCVESILSKPSYPIGGIKKA